jgi:hypothetical protein
METEPPNECRAALDKALDATGYCMLMTEEMYAKLLRLITAYEAARAQTTPDSLPPHPDVQDNLSEWDVEHLLLWMRNPKREPANTAFTAGGKRVVAMEIEALLRRERGSEMQVMGADKAVKKSTEQEESGTAPEAAGLEPECDRPAPATDHIGDLTRMIAPEQPFGLERLSTKDLARLHANIPPEGAETLEWRTGPAATQQPVDCPHPYTHVMRQDRKVVCPKCGEVNERCTATAEGFAELHRLCQERQPDELGHDSKAVSLSAQVWQAFANHMLGQKTEHKNGIMAMEYALRTCGLLERESRPLAEEERQAMERIVAGCLRSTIDAHGDIHRRNLASAAKRITNQLVAENWRKS